MTPSVCIAVEYPRSAEVMAFCRGAGREAVGARVGEVLSLWFAWAVDGARSIEVGADFEAKLAEHQVTWMLETRAGWAGEEGDLVRRALAAGVLALADGELTLKGFWERNSHLNPNAVPSQSRAAAAKRLKVAQRESEKGAYDAVQYLLQLGRIKPEDEASTKEVHILLQKLERALGLEQRPRFDYPDLVVEDALIVLRKFGQPKIDAVCQLLFAKRGEAADAPSVESVLRRFSKFVALARDAEFI